MLRRALVAVAAAFVGAVLAPATAWAARIDLEWRPAAQAVLVGADFGVELWAAAEGSQPVSLNSLQVITTWEPGFVRLDGVSLAGTVGLQTAAFTPGDSFGFNEANPPGDGDGILFGYVQLGHSVAIPPEGALLATLQFSALAPTSGTPVGMLATAQKPGRPRAETMVMSGTYNVVGTLSAPALIAINPAIFPGDLNCDGRLDFDDINPFVQILSDPAGWQAAHPGCPPGNGDCNGDGRVDFDDINPFVALLTGPG